MTINEHISHFRGIPVRDFVPGQKLDSGRFVEKITIDWDESSEGQTLTKKFAKFLAEPRANETRNLVFGPWSFESDDNRELLTDLVANAAKLPNLEGLMLGDIIMEESEVSWIEQGDLGPLLTAFPKLNHFQARGNISSIVCKQVLPQMKTLIIETGGLPKKTLDDVLSLELPNLEHFEIWLGSDWYGFDFGVKDIQSVFDGKYPKLKCLALRNSQIADEIAETLNGSKVMETIEILDLSLGNLSDVGAKALFINPKLPQLKLVDLHHHYISENWVKSLQTLGVSMVLSDVQEADEDGDRYVAVSE